MVNWHQLTTNAIDNELKPDIICASSRVYYRHVTFVTIRLWAIQPSDAATTPLATARRYDVATLPIQKTEVTYELVF